MKKELLFLRIVQGLNLASIPVGLAWLAFNFSWYYFCALAVAVIIISKVGNSIGTHRYFCHRTFKTGPIREWILAFFSTLSTTGPIIQYSAVHRYHHANSDVESDIHDPRRIGYWKAFLHHYSPDFNIQKKLTASWVKDLVRKKCCQLNYDHYWKIIFSYVALLSLIDPWLVLYAYAIPAGYAWAIGGVQTSPLHYAGFGKYQNYNVGDNSQNSQFWNIVTLGEGLHNNHHAKHSYHRLAHFPEKGEWDLPAWIIEKFFMVK
jgi:fatty-acid desaturase